MRLRYKILIGLAALLSAFAVGRFITPTRVEEKEKIVYKDKIVEKKVYVKAVNKKDNKVTVITVTVKPDGTKTTETKIVDKDQTLIDETGKTDIVKDTTSTKETSKVVENKHDDWLLSLAVKSNFNKLVPDYGATAQRRILGPFYLGVFAFTDSTFGGSIGISF